MLPFRPMVPSTTSRDSRRLLYMVMTGATVHLRYQTAKPHDNSVVALETTLKITNDMIDERDVYRSSEIFLGISSRLITLMYLLLADVRHEKLDIRMTSKPLCSGSCLLESLVCILSFLSEHGYYAVDG